jgi:hypothetical protein
MRLDAELKKDELAVISAGPAPKKAASAPTSILVRKGLEAEAQRIAARFPGSTLGPLGPKSPYDIVITQGSTPGPTPATAPVVSPAAAPVTPPKVE